MQIALSSQASTKSCNGPCQQYHSTLCNIQHKSSTVGEQEMPRTIQIKVMVANGQRRSDALLGAGTLKKMVDGPTLYTSGIVGSKVLYD